MGRLELERDGAPLLTPGDAGFARKPRGHGGAVDPKSTKNKIRGFNPSVLLRSTNSITSAPETVAAWHFRPQAIYQVSWTLPVTTRLLIEAGNSTLLDNWRQFPSRPDNNFNMISITDSARGFTYNSPSTSGLYDLTNRSARWAQRGSVSYITGSHAFKTGIQIEEGQNDIGTSVDHKIGFNGETIPGFPHLAVHAGWANRNHGIRSPFVQKSRIMDLGPYAQDH